MKAEELKGRYIYKDKEGDLWVFYFLVRSPYPTADGPLKSRDMAACLKFSYPKEIAPQYFYYYIPPEALEPATFEEEKHQRESTEENPLVDDALKNLGRVLSRLGEVLTDGLQQER